MKFDTLELVPAERPGGGGTTSRTYVDYKVNKSLLSTHFQYDFISVLGWLTKEGEAKHTNQILLKEKSELQSGRVPIYICPECGDLGCGCISVKLVEYDDCIVWSEFGYENNYEKEIVESYDLRD